MRLLAFVGVGIVASCTGSAPSGGNSADASGGACTMVIYDPCADEHNCPSGEMCQTFSDVTPSLEVCSQVCSASAPCPNDSTGAPGTCDAMSSLCRPAKANACTPTL